MKLFPSHQQTIYTSLPPGEVAARLSAHTLPKMPLFPLSCKRNSFWGTVDSHKFTISMIGEGSGHSFAPRIHGIMEADEAGTNLHLSMMLYSPVLFFLKFYIGFCVATFLVGIVASLIARQFIWAICLAPAFIGTCALVLTHFSFRMGRRNSLSSLAQILK